MGLLDRIMKRSVDPTSELKELFPIADCAPEDCDGCAVKYPSSMKIDHETPLWGSAPVWALQILTATAKTDWLHDVSDEKDSMAHALKPHVGELEKIAGGRIKLNATSMPLSDEHFESDSSDIHDLSADIVLLPYFIKVHTRPSRAAADLTEVAKVFANGDREKFQVALERITASSLPTGGLVTPLHDKVHILLCSHRTRDKRCGITAPLLKKQFEIELRHHDLYRDASDDRPDGARIHFVSHVGGHKFNANVIIYLRSGETLWMARVQPVHVKAIVEHTILGGQVFPELMRAAFKADCVTW
ncbi:actin patches distal protein 1 [Trichomonascus vanleenenianus]|uniref:sucrase/ferredoxin-like domain-containing protein n=1 Tax=Trichomonascus vanleenenianus TaxID=2268995 RepID=UPI003ECA3ADD